MYLDKPSKITKNGIRDLTGLCENGSILEKISVKNDAMSGLTWEKKDGRAMTIEDINDLGVKYATKVLAYKIYF